MPAGIHPSDYVGYSVGKPSSSTQAGYVGLLDFTGIPVGRLASTPAATAGYLGLLDFTGIPVGVGESVVPPTPLPSQASGGISYGEFRRRKRKKGDEEILFL